MSGISDFKRLSKIGQGAFGIAWLVESKIDSAKYVIKEIGLYKMHEKEKQEASKEVSLLSKMNHVNIVTYFNSFEEAGCFHILMEYCEGGDLYRRIKAQNGIPFKEDQVLDYFIQICLALKYIHDQKILHRDMKPQNIFLTKTNTVKLGDFGIAKVMNSTTALTKTTVGTPFYFSPEICEGRPYNNKSDIWSLGCILYEMCSLNYAFYGQDMTILAMQIKRVNYNPVPSIFSAPLRALIDNMFRRRPDERPNINAILRKPFILKKIDKFVPPESPLSAEARKNCQKRPSTANVVSRVDSGLSNKKKTRMGKDSILINSPYNPVQMRNFNDRRMPVRNSKQEEIKPSPLAIKQGELVNKMKVDRINTDRENGWKNIMSSDDNKSDNKEPKINVKPNILGATPPAAIKQKASSPSYDRYYAELDRIKEQQKLREKEGKALMQQMLKINDNKPIVKVSNGVDGVYRKANVHKQIEERNDNVDLGNLHGKLGANAGEQAQIIQEYLDRKRQAHNIKYRDGFGMAMVLGGPKNHFPIPRQTPQNVEEEIADRLNKIRQKNADQRKNQAFDNCMKRYDGENNSNFNQGDARKAIEELQKKLKQRTEDLKQRLDKKDKDRIKENKPTKDEDDRKNAVLFPIRNTPNVVNVPEISNNRPSPPQTESSLSVILGKLNQNITPREDCPKPEPTESFDNQPSMSVILSQMDDVSRPSTASSESSEIRKMKDNILKRLNKKSSPLPNEPGEMDKETPVRKSWVFDMDENHICKDIDLSDATLKDISFLNYDENEKKMAMWKIDEDIPSETIILKNIKAGNDSLNSEFDGSTMTLDEPSSNIDLPTVLETVDKSKLSLDDSTNLSTIMEATQELTEIELSESNHKETLNLIEREKVWEEHTMTEEVKHKTDPELPTEIKEKSKDVFNENEIICIEDDAETGNLDNQNGSDSSDCDRDELIECLKNVLSLHSSSSKGSNDNNDDDDNKTLTSDIFIDHVKISRTSSLNNINEASEVKMRRTKSDGEITGNWDKEWSSDGTGDFSYEDFGDDEIVDADNIFLRIEKFRAELEEKIGIDPLIDAIEFVRENQDLNGDELAKKLKQMIDDEASINDILQLVVLEEQYQNIE